MDLVEQTYPGLLAPLGGQPTVWAACLFADPIADVVVLGSPDDQELPNEAEAFNALVESATPIAIAEAPSWENEAWMLSLGGDWFQCRYTRNEGPLWVSTTTQPIVGSMSGSPIILNDGKAIGIVTLAVEGGHEAPNARLFRSLPVWLLQDSPKHPVVREM